MKKLVSCILVAAILIFSGSCSEQDDVTPHVSEYFSGLTAFETKAVVTCHYSDYTVDFTLRFIYDSEVGSTVTVEAPEELAGITASFNSDALLVSYDGASLETGFPATDAVAPISVLPQLFRVWSDGVISEQGKERISDTDYILISHMSDSGTADITYKTWFSVSEFSPYEAEILKDGETVIQCKFLLVDR